MQEKTKNILLGVLIVGLVSMTVAYAALTTNLQITGTANVAATKWNVRLEGWALDNSSTATGATTGTSSLSTNITKIENFTATLNKPGDFVKYNFVIANRGTIEAAKSSFSASLKLKSKTGGTDQNPTWGTETTETATAYGNITNGDVTANITCASDTPLAANTTSGACTLTITYNQLPTGANTTGQPSQTAGQDQTVDNPARLVTFTADWQYTQAD